jgi:hypothetical protein
MQQRHESLELMTQQSLTRGNRRLKKMQGAHCESLPPARRIRQFEKLADELAKGKAMEKILRG